MKGLEKLLVEFLQNLLTPMRGLNIETLTVGYGVNILMISRGMKRLYHHIRLIIVLQWW